ncbi:MAG: hypothetical protein ACK2UY_11000 [Anaerolineae bacterium]|jgi:hypothetical protein
MSTTQRIIVASVAFVLIFISGIWLSRSGKPYSTPVFTIHKLVGLGLGALLVAIVYQTHQVAPLGGLEIAAIAVTVLFFVGTVAAGGLLSIDKPAPAIVGTLHLVVPVLTVLSTGGTLYLLLRSI